MKILFISLLLIPSICLAWIDIPEDWKEVDVNFSHAIYLTPDGILMTVCHSCNAKIPLSEADKIIIDRRGQTNARLKWEMKYNALPWWKKLIQTIKNEYVYIEEPPIIVMNPGKDGKYEIADYEELYYCKSHNFRKEPK